MKFYDYKDGDFEVEKNGKDFSFHLINDEIFVRMDGGGPETVQMEFTKEEFITIMNACRTLFINAVEKKNGV